MKNTIQNTFLSSMLFSLSALATGPTAIVEIPVEKVFAPYQGFDDNDMVQIVIDGKLPNACYSLGRADVRVNIEKKEIVVVQTANIQSTGVCADPSKLPDELKATIPFDDEINLGQLDSGSYTIIYKSAAGIATRKLEVETAPSTTIDTLRYATVLNAFVQDFVPESAPTLEIRLTIQLNSSCQKISDNAKIVLQNDIYVVLPEVSSSNEMCLPVSRLAYKVVSVANPGVGRYMLHVRSLGGNAKNKLFSVVSSQ